ncbi:MAG: polymer-forming cytoskeletal protein [Erysipelothrix sp.]|nr:polymer-forming cytoskeletal protein [Erysipelothrix sp.]
MKKLSILLILTLFLAGCSTTPKDETPETPDAETVASSSDKSDVVAASLGKDGNWITAATADVSYHADLVVEGEFHDKGDDKAAIYRKLALHTQNDKFEILENFTLTTPKLVVKSENFTVFYGTIKGDIEVHAKGFSLVGTKVEGNITFVDQETQDSADLDKDAKGATYTGEVSLID